MNAPLDPILQLALVQGLLQSLSPALRQRMDRFVGANGFPAVMLALLSHRGSVKLVERGIALALDNADQNPGCLKATQERLLSRVTLGAKLS